MELFHLQTPTVKVTEKHTFIHVQERSDDEVDDCITKFARRPRAFTAPAELLRSCCKALKDDDGCHESTDYDSLDARSTCSWPSEPGDDGVASEHSSSCSSSLVDSVAMGPAVDTDTEWAQDTEWAPSVFHPTFLPTLADGYSAYSDFALVCFLCPQPPSSSELSHTACVQQGSEIAAARRGAKLAKNRRAGQRNSMGWSSNTRMKGSRETCAAETKSPTTVNLKNLPSDCTLSNVLDTLDREGFSGCYNFVHVPVNFKTKASLGYAQVNLLDHGLSELLCQHFQGFNNWVASTNSCEPSGCCVDWTAANQGLGPLIERYRNSPLMHESVPEEYKPALFSNARRIGFPAPTSRLKAPRMRHERLSDSMGVDEA